MIPHVVDASALVDVLAADGGTLPEGELHAPTLIDYEVVNTIRRNERLGAMTARDAIEALDTFRAIQLTRHAPRVLFDRMWAMRENLTAYDASYVALAEALDVALVTRDVRLARAAARYCEVIVPS